ncbi:hypothetical protein DES53_10334 [Roseimicrobium gellanilyticum]|uniref:HD domain-containing protein n=1 Tax=Roseimicrobium gellanilyticum TaxID=748857 RepID=A0A366HQB0_9BACT|nr:hypothetical protein [Roseimicrobium gellanilyticum]RBP45039.1 hypothetical protein DES53_10334 [Roseimicrobium gellanilyticum]
MINYVQLFETITQDPRYLANLDWGKARPGHPEGTVRAHIAEVEGNLARLKSRVSEEEYWRLRVLVHTHDTFKAEAVKGVSILDPRSHASLACAFLAEFCNDVDMLAIVQFHDVPFALWRQVDERGPYDEERFARLLKDIRDWDLFLAFCLIDGCTEGKGREPLLWLFETAALHGVQSRFSAEDVM